MHNNFYFTMSKYILDFEEPIRILEQKLVDLKNSSNLSGMDLEDSISSINYQIENEKSRIYNNLTRWEKIQLLGWMSSKVRNIFRINRKSLFATLGGFETPGALFLGYT